MEDRDVELIDAGLWDPAAPDARDRIELLRFFMDRGATVEELAEAEAQGRLYGLFVTHIVRPSGERFTLAEVAGRAGIDTALASQIWRSLGFPDPHPDVRTFTEDDAQVLQTLTAAANAGIDIDVALQMTRVLGSALARIAEAEVSALRTVFGADLSASASMDAGPARFLAEISAALLPRMADAIDVVHRHHLELTARRDVLSTVSEGLETHRLCIAFADLVGFTALSQRLSTRDLAKVIAGFESVAMERIVSRGGRVVKLIGDEVMFASPDPQQACETALELVEAFEGTMLLPPLRVGLAVGEVLAREGDYYGPVVNLASRAVNLAFPGTVLTTQDVREAVGDDESFWFRRVGVRDVKGFRSGVEFHTLRRHVRDDVSGSASDRRARTRARRAGR